MATSASWGASTDESERGADGRARVMTSRQRVARHLSRSANATSFAVAGASAGDVAREHRDGSLSRLVDDLRSQVSALSEERERMHESVSDDIKKELRSVLDNIASRRADRQREPGGAGAGSTGLEEAIEQIARRQEEIERETREADHRRQEAANAEFQAISARIETLKEATNSGIGGVRDGVGEVEHALKALNKSVEALGSGGGRDEVLRRLDEIAGMAGQLNAAPEAAERLRESLTTVEARLNTLMEAPAALARVEAGQEAALERIDATEGKAEEVRALLCSLQAKIEASPSHDDIRAMESRIAALAERLGRANEERASDPELLARLGTQVGEIADMLSSLDKRPSADADERLAELSKQVANVGDIEKLDAILDHLKALGGSPNARGEAGADTSMQALDTRLEELGRQLDEVLRIGPELSRIDARLEELAAQMGSVAESSDGVDGSTLADLVARLEAASTQMPAVDKIDERLAALYEKLGAKAENSDAATGGGPAIATLITELRDEMKALRDTASTSEGQTRAALSTVQEALEKIAGVPAQSSRTPPHDAAPEPAAEPAAAALDRSVGEKTPAEEADEPFDAQALRDKYEAARAGEVEDEADDGIVIVTDDFINEPFDDEPGASSFDAAAAQDADIAVQAPRERSTLDEEIDVPPVEDVSLEIDEGEPEVLDDGDPEVLDDAEPESLGGTIEGGLEDAPEIASGAHVDEVPDDGTAADASEPSDKAHGDDELWSAAQLLKRATGGRASFSMEGEGGDAGASVGAPVFSDEELQEEAAQVEAADAFGPIESDDPAIRSMLRGLDDDPAEKASLYLATARRRAQENVVAIAADDEGEVQQQAGVVARLTRSAPKRRALLAGLLAVAVAVAAMRLLDQAQPDVADGAATVADAAAPAQPNTVPEDADLAASAEAADEAADSGAGAPAEIAANRPVERASDPVASLPVPDLPPAAAGDALREAVLAGDAKARYEVGRRYTEGTWVERDLSRAAEWYELAAADGLAPAQYRLGSMYAKGLGVGRDEERAASLYEAAAEAGNVKAMHNLAVVEAHEPGADIEKAARWFREAARHGVTDSQFNLAMLHQFGRGVEKSKVEAFKWYGAAARRGDPDAKRELAAIGATMTPAERAEAKAALVEFRPIAPDPEANTVTPDPTWNAEPVSSTSVPSSPLMANVRISPGEPIAGASSGGPGSITMTVPVRDSVPQAVPNGKAIVRRAQALLNELGYEVGRPDGIAGPKTRAAVRAFQADAGIEPTGTIDARLVRALASRGA